MQQWVLFGNHLVNNRKQKKVTIQQPLNQQQKMKKLLFGNHSINNRKQQKLLFGNHSLNNRKQKKVSLETT